MEVPYPPPGKTSIIPLLVALGFLVAGALLLISCAQRPPPRPVASVDLARYAGHWYEIAAYPAWFQRSCVGGTTADYTLQPDGTVRVVNRCRTAAGGIKQVTGRATAVPGSANTKLKVSFGLPFLRGDYWIIGLDQTSYRWAIVGHPSRKYLWILARDPHLPERTYREILTLVAASGYDPSRLRRTPQP